MNELFHNASQQATKTDPRVRLENDEYRVVAPNGRAKDGRFFVNGNLVIEKKTKASLGEVSYVFVASIMKPSNRIEGDASLEQERQRDLALWGLLGNGGE